MTPTAHDPVDELRQALESRYAVDRVIGRGGMATVYLARDTEHGRMVALKVLNPALALGLGTERFLREIRIAAKMWHPLILPLLDYGHVDEVPYYVMPYVEGETLAHRIALRGAMPLDEVVAVIRDVADALDHAHAQDVIHRDIKPDNIMLVGRQALVADFGIGKALTGADQSSLTQTGHAIGTPTYMSLEQAAGDPDIDGRSDVYSLGVVCYEMLTGTPPFQGESAQAVIAHRFKAPAPRLADHRADLPDAVDAAVGRALAQRLEERFETAGAFAAALTEAAVTRDS